MVPRVDRKECGPDARRAVRGCQPGRTHPGKTRRDVCATREVQNCAKTTPIVNAYTKQGVINKWPAGDVDFVTANEPSGPTIYYNSSNFWQNTFGDVLGTLVHEYAHVNNMDATDQSFQKALGLPQSNDTRNISKKLAQDCFSGVKAP